MSSGIDKITNHPSFACKDEVMQICQPLEQLADIDYFAHVRVDKNGKFTALARNPEFAHHYWDNKYYNSDIHLLESGLTEEYIIQDNVEVQGNTEKLVEDCRRFSLHHIFTIIMRDEKYTNAYHFATSKTQSGFNELYLRHLPTLKKFIDHFNFNAQTDKKLSAAYDWKLNIERKSASYQSKYSSPNNIANCELTNNLERHYLASNSNVYLTQREVSVLQLMHQGMAAPDISIALKITERTVREHITNIKTKLNCKSLFQLGEIAANFLKSE